MIRWRLHRNIDFDPENEEEDLSDASESSSDKRSDKIDEDEDTQDEDIYHWHEVETDTREEEAAPEPVENTETEMSIEETHLSNAINAQEPLLPAVNDDRNHDDNPRMDALGNMQGVEQAVEPEGGIQVGARRSSGRVRKRTEIDSRCECDTLITLEEKEAGTRVMECKARGCETGWVCGICFHLRPTSSDINCSST